MALLSENCHVPDRKLNPTHLPFSSLQNSNDFVWITRKKILAIQLFLFVRSNYFEKKVMNYNVVSYDAKSIFRSFYSLFLNLNRNGNWKIGCFLSLMKLCFRHQAKKNGIYDFVMKEYFQFEPIADKAVREGFAKSAFQWLIDLGSPNPGCKWISGILSRRREIIFMIPFSNNSPPNRRKADGV